MNLFHKPDPTNADIARRIALLITDDRVSCNLERLHAGWIFFTVGDDELHISLFGKQYIEDQRYEVEGVYVNGEKMPDEVSGCPSIEAAANRRIKQAKASKVSAAITKLMQVHP